MASRLKNSTLVDQNSFTCFLLAKSKKPMNIITIECLTVGFGHVMLTVFWDAEGPKFCDYLEEQHTMNSQYYSDL